METNRNERNKKFDPVVGSFFRTEDFKKDRIGYGEAGGLSRGKGEKSLRKKKFEKEKNEITCPKESKRNRKKVTKDGDFRIFSQKKQIKC